MSSISSASSAVDSGVSSMMPWPDASTRSAQRSGLRSVLVAYRVPLVAMRPCAPGSAAGVFAVAPIEQVVAAFLARRGMVGNLVGGQTGGRRQLLRRLVESERRVLVRDHQLAGGVQAPRTASPARW